MLYVPWVIDEIQRQIPGIHRPYQTCMPGTFLSLSPRLLLLSNKPAVIFTAIQNIFYIYCIILDLVKDKIPFFYKHFVILVGGNIQFLKKGETMRLLSQGTHGSHDFFLFCRCCFFADLCHKTDMCTQHSFCPVGNDYFILLMFRHTLYLCNQIIEVSVQFIECTAVSSCIPVFLDSKKLFP